MDGVSLAEVRHWDKTDPLRDQRDLFALPDGVIYLDGNSLGPLPHATRDRLARVVADEWGARPDPVLGRCRLDGGAGADRREDCRHPWAPRRTR